MGMLLLNNIIFTIQKIKFKNLKTLVAIVLFILFSHCEIKKNPLAPNGPFGIYTLYFNLSKIGAWNYSDPSPIYSKDIPIDTNVPRISSLAIVKDFSLKTNLPKGLSLNQTNGFITGIPLEIGSTDVEIFANNDFFRSQFTSKLKILIAGFSYLPSYTFNINTEVSITPTFSENLNASDFKFSITPTLPNGISINQNNGVISGIVTEKKNSSYEVTAISQSNKKFIASFQLNIVAWENEAYLKAPNAEGIGGNGDEFGISVAISGDTIVVGAMKEDSLQTTITNGTLVQANDVGANDFGAAYVFRKIGDIWVNEAYLKAPNPNISDNFGNSVSISGDTIVVGASKEDSSETTIINGTTASADNSEGESGAAYVFRRTGNTWINEAYLKGPSTDVNDGFGGSVSISGDTIVISAAGDDNSPSGVTNGTYTANSGGVQDSGGAYVFRRTGTTWTNEAYLKAPNRFNDDVFGFSVSIHLDTIVVGALWEDSNQTTITNGTTASADNSAMNSGAVYVFKRNGTTWATEAYLKAPNTEANDEFGRSVAIFGDTIVVGATGEDSNQTTITNGTYASADNSAINSGAVYVFKRTGTTWTNEAYLKAPNTEGNDSFGASVSISGDIILVGATGEASNQTTITNGTLTSSNNSASGSGAVYIFKRTGTTWANEAYLKTPNMDLGDTFGRSVSISGETSVVGAHYEDSGQTTITNGLATGGNNPNTNASQGAAYVFRRK